MVLRVLTFVIFVNASASTLAASKPNVVLFLVDDMGWTDSSTYGSGYYETPHLDRLAAGGMKFTNAYAAANICSPTRASIVTGKSPARLQLTDWITGHGDAGRPRPLTQPRWTQHLKQSEVTIAEALRDDGYATAFIGKWHLGTNGRTESDPTTQGFDLNIGGTHRGSPNGSTGSYFANASGSFGLPGLGNGSSTPGEYLTDRLTTAACDYIEVQAGSERPFFLMLSHYAIHTPIQAKPALIEKYRNKQATAQHSNATYAAMIESMDDSLGGLLDQLEDPNRDGDNADDVSQNTVVIFLSDNGGLVGPTRNSPLRAGKGTNYEGGVRIPLVVRWPGRTPASSVSDSPVISHDLYPTILAITGAEGFPAHNAELDGEDLSGILEGSGEREAPLFFHYPHYHTAGATPHSAIRDGDWKLILNYETSGVSLYDLSSDMGESRNVAAANPDRVADLRSQLVSHFTQIQAQLPTGTDVEFDRDSAGGADVISVNLGTGPNTTMGPQEFAGVVPEDHWNNAISAGQRAGSASLANLVDGNGDATGASFAFEAGYMFFNGNNESGDYRMMEGWAGNKASDAPNDYSLRNLPESFATAGYDVYLYYDSDFLGDRARRMSFRIGADTRFVRELPVDFAGVFVECDTTGVTSFASAREGNYLVFRNLSQRSLDIVADADGGVRATMNGLQIVRHALGEGTRFQRGDCNVDGVFDLSDPVKTLISLFTGGSPLPCDDACDANDDGFVNISDAVTALDALFRGGGPLPFPAGGACGPDLSDDLIAID
ncbi:MAG: sulfatase, partial [Planctomycetota bacterium]